jgi:acyl-CoA synthetase (AMP-forming)/AMP-acid ligase II
MSPEPDLVALLEASATTPATVSLGEVDSRDLQTCAMSDLWVRSLEVASQLEANTDSESLGIVLEPTRSSVCLLLGAWIAGFRVVSIPPPSHRGQAHRLARISTVENLDVIVANPAEHQALHGAANRLLTAEDLGHHRGQQRIRRVRNEPRLVQYTSGTVEEPAGVELTTGGVATNITAILEVVDPIASDRALSWLPLYHDMGLIGMLLASLVGFGPDFAGGGHLTLFGPELFIRDPRNWLRACSAHDATITAGPTSAFELATVFRPSKPDLGRLRVALIGAEPVHSHVVDRFIEAFGPYGLRSEAMCPSYGLAEAALAVSIGSPTEHIQRHHARLSEKLATGTIVSCGRPLRGIDVKIDDAVDGIGRIFVRSPSLLHRYTGNRVAKFHDGYLDTHDVGLLHDGELYVLGRSDDVIIVGGRNLHPADIEAAVSVALSVPTRSVAAVATDRGYELFLERRGGVRRLSEHEIHGKVISATAGFGAHPSSVTTAEPGKLPRTANGKLRRRTVVPHEPPDPGPPPSR